MSSPTAHRSFTYAAVVLTAPVRSTSRGAAENLGGTASDTSVVPAVVVNLPSTCTPRTYNVWLPFGTVTVADRASGPVVATTVPSSRISNRPISTVGVLVDQAGGTELRVYVVPPSVVVPPRLVIPRPVSRVARRRTVASWA